MTQNPTPVFSQARWLSHNRGVVFLHQDWTGSSSLPPLFLNPGKRKLKSLERAPLHYSGQLSGYYIQGGKVTFLLWPEYYPNLDLEENVFYVAGDFNGWEQAISDPEWRMHRSTIHGAVCLCLTVSLQAVATKGACRFKFVSEEHYWPDVPMEAPNREENGNDSHNFILNPVCTGKHVFFFEPDREHPLMKRETLLWKTEDLEETCPITFGPLLLSLKTEGALGVHVTGEKTVFRLFAPRASRVQVLFFQNIADEANGEAMPLWRVDECLWEGTVEKDLSNWYYYYQVDGAPGPQPSHFDSSFRILDPYALAAVSCEGPGIILPPDSLPKVRHSFQPPAWQDLVIVEAHVRDLIAHCPLPLSPVERRGFKGVTRWLRSPDCYLKSLGVNAVELQPVQEFDNKTPEEYHWGYMPCNWFAPESSYSTDPARGAQVEEFAEMVQAFHEANIAVILDVVYNHVGVPGHLMYIDKQYYFETDPHGQLMNWSGCGNDFRAHTPMGKRLIIDSLIHLVKTYDVDGFRFDLAELIGVDVLKEIETAVKAVKPSVILISEPWSFRGHIVHSLRHTGYSSWNDGYRDFMLDYVCGRGNREGLRYFMEGSPHFFAMFPAQTVNYTESHDDRCWIDRLTENPEFNGNHPTIRDCRRTHLMASLLFMSIGIPMLAAGQDFFSSKQGVNNTYQRGDLNALDYERWRQFSAGHDYFRRWVQFRLSHHGRLLRLEHRQSEKYMIFFGEGEQSAEAVLFNADGSLGDDRLFYAVNPHSYQVEINIESMDPSSFSMIADHERWDVHGLTPPHFFWENGYLVLPPLSCGLWVSH